MILMDTSVWIEYFRKNAGYKSDVDRLLKSRQVITLDFIFGELLQDAKEHEKEGKYYFCNNSPLIFFFINQIIRN